MKNYIIHLLIAILIISCRNGNTKRLAVNGIQINKAPAEACQSTNFYDQLADSVFSLTKEHVKYDPTYFEIAYPNGDVPKGKGVCTDVVIRAFRKMQIDLQKEVHEDMKNHFSAYPKK
jgi:uncharacterized protein YijF (DUF1287 family)